MIKNFAIVLLIFLGFSNSFAGDMNYLRTDGSYHLSLNKDQTFVLTTPSQTIESVYELSDESYCPVKLYSPSGKTCCIGLRELGPKVVIDKKSAEHTFLYSDIAGICKGGVFDKVK